jgi:tetratricopeptide (TPR) repeat protein
LILFAELFTKAKLCVIKTAMPDLEARDKIAVEAAAGWLLLNNPAEALIELEQITPAQRSHPEVLLTEWEAHAHAKSWDKSIEIADRLIVIAPELPAGYIKKAFALHELMRTKEAWDCLHTLSERFFEHWVIPYNLACYACQLGRPTDALNWFRRALRVGDKKEVRTIGLEDPDLEPIRDKIKQTENE